MTRDAGLEEEAASYPYTAPFWRDTRAFLDE